ncbi:CBS domain-containing protein [Porticoccaceae bacterium LTM1]|nr:CBS domain-containing protein [Porticoccaceae bacterium LTM1]
MPKQTIPTLGEVMTASPTTIDINATLSQAKVLMEQLGVDHLPVMDNEVVETIVSDRDIKRFTLPAHELREDEEPLVRDITPVRASLADFNDPLDRVLDVMHDRHVSAVIVLKEGELAGIFTETDACGLLASLLRETASK